jgi:drug/metabolite transporter (DMT)-like permease
MASSAENRRGIAAMLAAMALFVGNDTLVKLASGALPASQVMALRGLFATAFALVLTAGLGEFRRSRALLNPLVGLRACLEASISFTFITAVAHLPLANITAILQATPIVLTLLAIALRIEQVGWRRWLAILVGFAGVLIVVRPSARGVDLWSLLALLSAVLVAVRDLVTRRIGSAVPSGLVTLGTTVVVAMFGCALGASEGFATWLPLAVGETLFLAAAAAFVSAGNYAIIVAFRGSEVAVVSPFRYSMVVWAVILGWLVWGDVPDIWGLIGTMLIVGAGLYAIHRERVRLRQARVSDRALSAAPDRAALANLVSRDASRAPSPTPQCD